MDDILGFVDLSSMTYKVHCDRFISEIGRINNSPIANDKFKHPLKLSFFSPLQMEFFR
jgi:hypothetical protein